MKEGYQYNKACELAGYKFSKYSLTKDENARRILQKHLDFIPHNSLRNPLVERILNQMISLVNSLVDEYGDTYGTFDEKRNSCSGFKVKDESETPKYTVNYFNVDADGNKVNSTKVEIAGITGSHTVLSNTNTNPAINFTAPTNPSS